MSFSIPALTLTAAATSRSTGPLNVPAGSVGLHCIINIATITGTSPTLTVAIQGWDPVSSTWYPLISSAALNAAGQTVLRVLAGATPATNTVANDILPPQIQVVATIAGTTPAITATIGLNVIASPVL
jgi:hypothetical protein